MLEHGLGELAIIGHATRLHKRWVSRKALNVTVLGHVEHALEIGTVGKYLDCHNVLLTYMMI